MFKLFAENISRRFDELTVFQDISFEIHSGQALAITGPNGSGKSTLIRILCRLMHQSQGSVIYKQDERIVRDDLAFKHIGLVSPYLELYEDLTARENLHFFSKMKGVPRFGQRIERLMFKMNLAGREDDIVKTYSSGMKQRLKYVFALLDQPQALFVDEPRSNLDEAGIEIVYEILAGQKKEKMLVIATNDKQDLQFADQIVRLDA